MRPVYVPPPTLRDRFGWLPRAILEQAGGVIALFVFVGGVAAYVALAEALLRAPAP